MNKKAFSLLELLIVVSVIFILISTIFSVFSKIQEHALMISCKSNLRQMGIALLLYSNENKGKLPHTNRDSDTGYNYCWFDQIDVYLSTSNLNQIKQCPSWQGYSSPETTDEHSIKMNGGLCPKERLPETEEDKRKRIWYWPRLWSIPKKSTTVLLLDGRVDLPYNTYTDTRSNHPYYDTSNRHLSGVNILFVDGSIQNIKSDKDEKIGWKTSKGYVWEIKK